MSSALSADPAKGKAVEQYWNIHGSHSAMATREPATRGLSKGHSQKEAQVRAWEELERRCQLMDSSNARIDGIDLTSLIDDLEIDGDEDDVSDSDYEFGTSSAARGKADQSRDSFDSARSGQSDSRNSLPGMVYTAGYGSPSLPHTAPASPFHNCRSSGIIVPSASSGSKASTASAAPRAAAAAAAAGASPMQQRFTPGAIFSSPQYLHQPNPSPEGASVVSGSSPLPMAFMPRHSSLNSLNSPAAAPASAAADAAGTAHHARSNTGSPKTIFRYSMQGGQTPPDGAIPKQGKNGQETSSTEGEQRTSRGGSEGAAVDENSKRRGGATWAAVGHSAAAEGRKTHVRVKAGANPAAVEAYLKLKAERAGRR